MDSATMATTARLLNLSPNPSSTAFLPSRHRSNTKSLSFPIRCLHIPNPNPNPKPLSCSALAPAAPPVSAAGDAPRGRLRCLVTEFGSLTEPIERVKRLLAYAADLPDLSEADRAPSNRVMGCTAQVWVRADMDEIGRMRFVAGSDSEITKGFCACLISVLDGASPEEVLEMRPDDFGELNVVGLPGRAHSRLNTWQNVLISMQKRTKALVAEREGRNPVEPFPSLLIGADGIKAKGSYAEAQ